MKGKNQNLAILLGSGLIIGGVLVAGQSLATGDQTDPLVTLSYLEQTVTPALKAEAKAQALSVAEDFYTRFDKEIALLEAEFKSLSDSGSTHQYQLVTLSTGQSITLDLGALVVLRVGAATVSGVSSPALVDLTGGSTLESGASLKTNHQYLASIAARTITASEPLVRVLVYGGYQVG